MRKYLTVILSLLFACCIGFGTLAACNNQPEHTHAFASYYSKDQSHHWKKCECGEKKDYAEHLFENNVCVCGYEKPVGHVHAFGDTYLFDSINHWKECECGETGEMGAHKGGSASETAKAVCEVCFNPYGTLLGHVHEFNKQVVDDNYFNTPADCDNKATYFYSCECGEKGVTTFAYGDPLGHAYGDFSSNGNGTHSKTCANNANHKITEDCSFNNYISNGDGTKVSTCACGGVSKIADGSIFIIENKTLIGLTEHGKTLSKITIPDDVTKVAENAFYNATALESITISKSVKRFERSAFSDCTALSKVNYLGTIDEWVQLEFASQNANPIFYSNNLYINDTLVEEVYLTAKKINDFVFYSCDSIRSIMIPYDVESIGDEVFTYCDNINYHELNGLNYLGSPENTHLYLVSAKDTSIKTAIIDPFCRFIGCYAFMNCQSLSSVTIPERVEKIGRFAFAYCSSLNTISLPNSVKSVGNYAFQSCTALTKIYVPSSVTTMGKFAIYACDRVAIYCGAAQKPNGWDDNWNALNRPVFWGRNSY